jgi:hypothetical protein
MYESATCYKSALLDWLIFHGKSNNIANINLLTVTLCSVKNSRSVRALSVCTSMMNNFCVAVARTTLHR